MKYWAGDIIQSIEESYKKKNYKGLIICSVKSIHPFVFTYKGVDVGASNGDIVFVHPLMIGTLINQNENGLSTIQSFMESSAYKSPQFVAKIEGTIPDFIKDFYLFYKDWQSNYLLKEGDLIAVYELEDSYLVLQKVNKDTLRNN